MACLAGLLSLSPVRAAELAIVKDGRVNVRGQPSLAGEVITQLQKGEKVVVLEELTAAKPKTNEPPKWARIQLPQNTPVWVFASFIDDSSKTVRVSRVNLRAGPGENYSVIGRLDRGAAVTEIRRVEDWMEIETPSTAFGFVAATLLSPQGPAPAAAETTHAPAVAPPAETSRPPAVVVAPAPAPSTNGAPPSIAPLAQRETEQAPPPKAATKAPMPAEPPPVTVPNKEQSKAMAAKQTVNQESAAKPAISKTTFSSSPVSVEKKKPEPPLIKRIVRREGLVRSSVSIQAPTYFELLNSDNHRTINYLHTDKIDVKLDDYRGRKIVVTGEEAIDPRWPRTPVLEVETLELIP